MAASPPDTIIPPCKFEDVHTFYSVSSNDANRFIFRIHLSVKYGMLRPEGFIASANTETPLDAMSNARYIGSGEELRRLASAHITQYKDGTWRQPTSFISASYSLPYTLFEAQRRTLQSWSRPHGSEILISIIDTTAIPNSDIWLGTELVGAYGPPHAAYFARWAQEVLVYRFIPRAAVVATMSVGSFLDCLPRWCSDIKHSIEPNCLWSTESVVGHLRALARCKHTLEEQEELLAQSVERSLATLRLPFTSEEAVDSVSRLAAIFYWWPRWIVRTDPSVYTALLERVRQRVRERLKLGVRVRREM
ncbi:hypothetical protein C8F04DRAFT_1146704 [Mycena alexandri]|uniref:DUF7587 domain-containing protein n=1 Tax=Mycena alexandri TaxID=1745969 RepID=A0AAD6S2D9_9AGAR|nr:hypothetical protein C8F04DRAFT_1146704 [Mycena alexandri]